MARRKTPRLAYCEYVSPDRDNSNQVWIARQELIEAVKRTYPKLLEALSEDVFPLYFKLASAGYDFDRILSSPAVSPYDALTEEGGLKQALLNWATQFNADCPWLMDDALQALRGWYVAPDWRTLFRWNTFHGSSSSGATGKPFEFSYMGWETELLTWSRYSQLLQEQLDKKLSEYEADTRKIAESCGLVRARHKYSPANFDWFVLYQFAGRSSTEIARRGYGDDPDSTVLKGIKAAAKLIGWDHLREPEVGQKRKIQ